MRHLFYRKNEQGDFEFSIGEQPDECESVTMSQVDFVNMCASFGYYISSKSFEQYLSKRIADIRSSYGIALNSMPTNIHAQNIVGGTQTIGNQTIINGEENDTSTFLQEKR